ncbi:DHH family phosphoesterase [Candidatus Micrarchaeota archaeon]|nr:DHH family phosphoesterase [Candidatus Micrarchaeota archaeon]
MALSLAQPVLTFFKKNKNKKAVIIVHSIGDIDSVGSAFALTSWFKNASVVMPDNISAASKKLASLLNLKFSKFPSNPDIVLITDTNSKSFLGKYKDKKINCVLDHHSIHNDSVRADLMLVDNTYTSTCEIVYELLKELKVKIDKKTATCLAAGIIYDSAQFKTARNKTFKYVHDLLVIGKVEYEKLLILLDVPLDLSQRMALLKSAQRMEITREGNFIIASSAVGSFEAASASSFVELGADFAFVGCHCEDGRISARARSELSTKINLASIMGQVAKEFNGSGGGHPAAAGLNNIPTERVEDALKRCVQITQEKLKKLPKA